MRLSAWSLAVQIQPGLLPEATRVGSMNLVPSTHAPTGGVIERCRMQHSSIVQILKVNDPREGVGKTGKAWKMQEAECILLDSEGAVSQVGVLDVPKELIGVIVPGTYTATFSLAAHYQTRKIESRLTALTRLPTKGERAQAEAKS